MAPLIYVSDDTIRHGTIERKHVKHCYEVLWLSGSGNGGVGFGNNDSYVRFQGAYDFTGSNRVEMIDRPSLLIPMTDGKRGLVCLDNTQQTHVFTIIKQNLTRVTKFRFQNKIETIRIITYNGGTGEKNDCFNIYTQKKDFEYELPPLYKAWGDDPFTKCMKQKRFLVTHMYAFTIVMLFK